MIEHLEHNIRRIIGEIRPQLLRKLEIQIALSTRQPCAKNSNSSHGSEPNWHIYRINDLTQQGDHSSSEMQL